MYFGNEGVYSSTFEYEKNAECIVCGSRPLLYELDRTNDVAALLDKLRTDAKLKLKSPSVTVGGRAVYMSNKLLAAQYAENLAQPIGAFFESGATLHVSDREVLGERLVKVKVVFVDGAMHAPVEASE